MLRPDCNYSLLWNDAHRTHWPTHWLKKLTFQRPSCNSVGTEERQINYTWALFKVFTWTWEMSSCNGYGTMNALSIHYCFGLSSDTTRFPLVLMKVNELLSLKTVWIWMVSYSSTLEKILKNESSNDDTSPIEALWTGPTAFTDVHHVIWLKDLVRLFSHYYTSWADSWNLVKMCLYCLIS